ncbi:MAG: hypothetical protein HY296_02210 [Thaumarchaeota archaeon]|nr:hypothetical protein [Nitrososphaerota archaeon]
MNEEWHLAHVMPRDATRKERVIWHGQHDRKCGCRPVPDALRKEVDGLRKKTRSVSQ